MAMRAAQTASVIENQNAHGPTFTAQVRELDNKRTYLRRWPTRTEAEAACAEYIATGHRPEPQKRGTKPGQKKRPTARNPWETRKAAWTPPEIKLDRQAAPLPTAERLARIAAKTTASPPPLPRSGPPARQDGGNGTQGQIQAISAPAPMTPEQRADRLEALKAAWRGSA